MSSEHAVRLKDRRTGELRDAVLLEGLGKEEVEAAVASWEPVLKAELARMEQEGVPREKWPQHLHWDWRRKQQVVEGLLAYRIFGIRCDGEFQGLMLVATAGKSARTTTENSRPLIYIHYLATAPWNSSGVVQEPRFSGVGSVLMAAAVQLSIDEEFSGRVGLHSLPQADAWYRQCGMTDLGPDADEKQTLRYFEMTPEQAKKYLS